jgi:hypothetical protein
MQVVEQESQSRLVPLHNLRNEFAIHRLIAKQNLYGLGPRSIDFFFTDGLVAVAEMQANEPNEPSDIVPGSSLLQIRNGHRSHPPNSDETSNTIL